MTATPEMAQETHADIRKYIAENVSPEVARQVRIQYGGSMKGANAAELLQQVRPSTEKRFLYYRSERLTKVFVGISSLTLMVD